MRLVAVQRFDHACQICAHLTLSECIRQSLLLFSLFVPFVVTSIVGASLYIRLTAGWGDFFQQLV